jgi:hypothetical protein
MELVEPSLPLQETLQRDDIIVLKWQILFARVYKNTLDPTLQLHVYDTEMCVCVWGGGSLTPLPISFNMAPARTFQGKDNCLH